MNPCINNCSLFDETFGVLLPFLVSQPCSQSIACAATGGALSNDPDQVSLNTYLPYILGAAIFIGGVWLIKSAGGR